ncbi:hypothetical protein Ahy_A09g042744 [Arachis hypogaea]|uniref:Uncharacterized protein n=1 Tax=Arachis hypogaea TaxID=3818 RepID=A0A445BGP5_ARAHY|nr:hypothetical protein Ahy_A09g042744 [Arachis hypogaea]
MKAKKTSSEDALTSTDQKRITCGNSREQEQPSINSSTDSIPLLDGQYVSIVGTPVETNLCSSSGAEMASLAPESRTCLAISDSVLRGLAVVRTAPIDNTARHMVGNRIELGDRRNSTSPFLTPSPWNKADAREYTDLRTSP